MSDLAKMIQFGNGKLSRGTVSALANKGTDIEKHNIYLTKRRAEDMLTNGAHVVK